MKRLSIFSMILALLQGWYQAHAQGEFLGVTSVGGTHGTGVIYKINPDGTGHTVLHNFFTENYGDEPEYNPLIELPNGKFLGVINQRGSSNIPKQAVIFEYDPVSNTYTKKAALNPGLSVIRGLTLAPNGKYYGIAGSPAPAGERFFEFDYSTNIVTLKVSLSTISAQNPFGNRVVAANGKIYGTTHTGGTSFSGLLYEYDPVTDVLIKKIDFGSPLGVWPTGLVLTTSGNMYGVTKFGGTNNQGTVFVYDPAANVVTTLANFQASLTGSMPQTLIQADNGKFYGVTDSGGFNNFGTLFEFDPAGNTLTKKIEFNNNKCI